MAVIFLFLLTADEGHSSQLYKGLSANSNIAVGSRVDYRFLLIDRDAK